MTPAVVLAMLAPALGLVAAGEAYSTFPLVPPDMPLELKLASPAAASWGRTPALRAVYLAGGSPDALDRATVLRELRLIQDFYAHYGLSIVYEDRVYEVVAPIDERGYDKIKARLKRLGLYLPSRTIVFTDYDTGLGGGMALTGLNDARVRRRECKPGGPGKAWWCGYPVDAHWGGCVHEVGHMLGLSHAPDSEADRSVMGHHERFFTHADNGLLPQDVEVLKKRFGETRER